MQKQKVTLILIDRESTINVMSTEMMIKLGIATKELA